MKNVYTAAKEYPFHLSIGAVLVNSEGDIACHFFKKQSLDFESEGRSDLYLLMRETPQLGESIEQTIARGLMEEFGAIGEVVHFIGAINSWFPGVTTGLTMYKTTPYFLVNLVSINERNREKNAVESRSEIRWIKPDELIHLFKEQGKKYERTDLNESQIIENYLQYVGQ